MTTTINKQPQGAHDNGHLNNGAPSVSVNPPPPASAPSTSTSASTSAANTKPAVHRINPSQFSFTPMRQPPPPSPLSQVAHYGSNTSSGSATPSDSTQPTMKVTKKVHIAQPEVEPDAPPCFIHSGLDKHGSLQDWLRGKADHFLPHPHHRKQPFRDHRESAAARRKPQTPTSATGEQVSLPSALRVGTTGPAQTVDVQSPETDDLTPRPFPQHPSMREIRDKRRADGYESDNSTADSRFGSPPDDGYDYDYDEDDDEPSSSLTRQLAATAQGVREVSKELGRTTVRSRIQHILIVTKARDNGLIRLTRELALYLMQRELPISTHSAASSMTDLSRFSERSERGGASRRIVVYVDAQLRNSKRFDAEGLARDYPHLFEPIPRRRSSTSNSASTTSLSALASSWGTNGSSGTKPREDGQLRYWTADMCSNSPQLFDFVVTLGGDGTVLFTSWLFQKIVPPVLPFALGSLGFLTNFDFKNYRKTMDTVIDEGIRVNLRMRFTCTVYRAIAPDESMIVKSHGKRRAIRRPGGDILVRQVDKDGWDSLEGGLNAPQHTSGKEKEVLCFTTRPVEQFEVLNDLIVDRGPSPFVSLLEVFGDDHHLTTVQADGLTVSTPTGSTAYSLSAGGSLVHPQIPALLLTPICPHTLSFRPMLLPDSMELRVCVPYNSRSTAWASFDGRGRIELKQGDHIKITASKYPFPTVCADKQSTDWFSSISRTLRWNERERQKSFVVVEEDAEPAKKSKRSGGGEGESYDEHGDEEDDYDSDGSYFSEDEFDIDDRSGGETPSPRGAVPAVQQRIRSLVDTSKSGVQSPDRFASGYNAPPPLSQRHLLEKLATVESQLRLASLNDAEAGGRYADVDDNLDDTPLAEGPEPGFARCESDATLDGKSMELVVDPPQASLDPGAATDPGPSAPPTASNIASRHGRSESITIGALTPRQGRSRSRSRHRSAGTAPGRSRSRSPHVGAPKTKAFAFFGQDDSTSELSDHSF